MDLRTLNLVHPPTYPVGSVPSAFFQTGEIDVTVQETIERKIQAALTPSHLDVINESHMHNVPPGSESHFKLVIVSSVFENLSLVQRHRKVNGILAKEHKDGIHALSLRTLTPPEWEQCGGETMASPLCHGAASHAGK